MRKRQAVLVVGAKAGGAEMKRRSGGCRKKVLQSRHESKDNLAKSTWMKLFIHRLTGDGGQAGGGVVVGVVVGVVTETTYANLDSNPEPAFIPNVNQDVLFVVTGSELNSSDRCVFARCASSV